MQITSIDAFSLSAELPGPMRSRGDVGFTEYFHTGSERQRVTAVRIHPDSGHAGITILSRDAREWIERVARKLLIGADPRVIRHHLKALRMESIAQGLGGTEPLEITRAEEVYLNRLEFALWDLAAQAAGIPLFRFLGGSDPRVMVYAGGGSLCWNPLPLLLEEADQLVAGGHVALKIKIGHGPEEDAEIVRAIRARVPPYVRIMVDANRAYDLESALKLAPTLEEAEVGWFEEPFVYDDPEPWRVLRQRARVKIAGGEGFSRVSQAADALREGIVHILQCDAGGFGLHALLATATLAQEYRVSLMPHSCNGVIGFVVACHLQTALPNRQLQEFETFDNPFIHRLFNEPFTVENGCLALPETPGLGFTFNEATLERYRVDG
jgi:L-alanine-DL-glutamate epimerase-like enolase superfamily enzyme